jgi:hypothetical protein
VEVDHARDGGAPRHGRERTGQPLLTEERRVDAVREVAQLLDGLLELPAHPRHDRAGPLGVVGPQPLHPPQVDGQGRQALLGAVVQVTLDGAAGLEPDLGDPSARGPQVGGPVGQAQHLVPDADHEQDRHDRGEAAREQRQVGHQRGFDRELLASRLADADQETGEHHGGEQDAAAGAQ